MKKLFLIFLLLAAINLTAQEAKIKYNQNYDKYWIHFGFTVGLNTMDFIIQNSAEFLDPNVINQIYSIENHRTLGFQLGPIINLRISEHMDFRFLITFSFGQRNLQYLITDTTQTQLVLSKKIMDIPSTFMEFPLLLKYKGDRLNNIRPYVITGIAPKYDLATRKKIKEEEKPKIKLKQFDYYYTAGAGMDFYLPYFKLSVEFKFDLGFKNVMVPDDTQYTKAIDKLRSKSFMLSFHFEG
jgi:hypothetical protein